MRPGAFQLSASIQDYDFVQTIDAWQRTVTFNVGPSDSRSINPATRTTPVDASIENLPPLTMVGFRVNVAGVDGPGEWSPIMTVLVH